MLIVHETYLDNITCPYARFFANLPIKGRTIPIKGYAVTFFQLKICHFPKHKSSLFLL